jgi:uncharacterized protein (TIGR03382 family)
MGDSGGPALSTGGAVLGVYSTNVVGCEGSSARNFFTSVSQFRPLVLDAYEAAGATPWLEGQKRPGVWPDGGAPSPAPPEQRLDAGPLQTHDSAGEQLLGRPSGEERRVDSGFCSLRRAPPSPEPPATWPLASLLLGWLLRRRSARG